MGKDREAYLGFKQITVNVEIKLSALEKGETFGDGETQSAPFCGAGYVTSDKALCQFIGGYVQRILRDILDSEINKVFTRSETVFFTSFF